MTASKIVAAAASGAGGGTIDVDDVFSTFLYNGNGGTQSIVNNIDLTEGGLVWAKRRDSTSNGSHTLMDTERGTSSRLRSDNNQQAYSPSDAVTAFNNNGFSLGADASINGNGYEMVSWTFRKAEKFFDIVTYTGDGSNGRAINHNLGSVPGMIIIKMTNASDHWTVYHRGMDSSSPEDYRLRLNTTDTRNDSPVFADTAPTSTQFTLGSYSEVNANGYSYVAYLFAHNNNDGGFGPDSDQDIIKCGSYTSDGGAGPVNVGFEPQLVVIKASSDTGSWMVFDCMRGTNTSTGSGATTSVANDNTLYWNLDNAELTNTGYISFDPIGFKHEGGSGDTNTSGRDYVYMAIRRGPLAEPDDATKVFGINEGGTNDSPTNNFTSVGFVPDMSITTRTSGTQNYLLTRLYGSSYLKINATTKTTGGDNATAAFNSPTGTLDLNTNWWGTDSNVITWSWKRAKGYFDVVAYAGSGGQSQSISHNLGVIPEMIWVKCTSSATNWAVYHKDLGISYVINFDTGVGGTGNQYWGTAAHTSSVFKVGSDGDTGGSSDFFTAYLFATLAGISKVGSYTGNGADGRVIDCGFSSGARFVLIKSSSHGGSWFVFDSTRGIVSGNDPRGHLNNTDADYTGADYLDPSSSGFIVNNANGDLNDSGRSYIFYAIA